MHTLKLLAQCGLLLVLPAVVQAQFTFITNNGAITITGYTGSGGNVVIPASTNGWPVTAIGINAFYNKTTITNVTMPNSVTSIGVYAFYNCSGLTSVAIPNSVTNIDDYAFYYCSGLTNATIGNSVTSIGDDAFAGSGLTIATIGNSVTSIGYAAFGNCYGLTSVTIPNSVNSIGFYAFLGCSNLTNAYFQGNAPKVNGGAGSADNTVFSGESGTAYYRPGTTGWGSTFGGWPTALWYQPQPQILGSGQSFGVRSNRFNFTISWATNLSVVIQACTNLSNPVWTSLATNPLVSGTNYFSDPKWTNYPRRFYRIRSP